jgi:hypothetical protein
MLTLPSNVLTATNRESSSLIAIGPEMLAFLAMMLAPLTGAPAEVSVTAIVEEGAGVDPPERLHANASSKKSALT